MPTQGLHMHTAKAHVHKAQSPHENPETQHSQYSQTHMHVLEEHVEIKKENSSQSNSRLPNSDNSPHTMLGSEDSKRIKEGRETHE